MKRPSVRLGLVVTGLLITLPFVLAWQSPSRPVGSNSPYGMTHRNAAGGSLQIYVSDSSDGKIYTLDKNLAPIADPIPGPFAGQSRGLAINIANGHFFVAGKQVSPAVLKEVPGTLIKLPDSAPGPLFGVGHDQNHLFVVGPDFCEVWAVRLTPADKRGQIDKVLQFKDATPGWSNLAGVEIPPNSVTYDGNGVPIRLSTMYRIQKNATASPNEFRLARFSWDGNNVTLQSSTPLTEYNLTVEDTVLGFTVTGSSAKKVYLVSQRNNTTSLKGPFPVSF